MPPMPQTEPPCSAEPAIDSLLDQSKLLGLVGFNLRHAYLLKIIPFFRKRMAKYHLKPVEYTILELVKEHPNITQKRLSQAINVSPPNLAPLLDKLQARALLTRQRNPLDKRSQTLTLTPEGQRTCAKAEKTIAELDLDATAALTEAERVELIRLLQKMSMPMVPKDSKKKDQKN